MAPSLNPSRAGMEILVSDTVGLVPKPALAPISRVNEINWAASSGSLKGFMRFLDT